MCPSATSTPAGTAFGRGHTQFGTLLRLGAQPSAQQQHGTSNGEAAKAINQRSDVCAVPAAGIVAEAMVALVLAESFLEKFGGDSLMESKRNLASYLENMKIK